MTILLTGATGFIGMHVCEQALNAGHSVVALVRPQSINKLPVHPRLRQVTAAELGTVAESELNGCDACIHLAAHGINTGGADWTACFQTNVHASLQLWMTAAKAGVRRFVICGSCFEYGRSGERYERIPVDAPLEPTGAYHASKAAATMAAVGLAIDQKLELAVVRPFHVYGEGEAESRFWPSLRRAARAGQDFKMTEGAQIRDFIPVEDAARSILEKAVHGPLHAGRPYVENLGTGAPRTIRDFAEDWWRRFHATGRLCFGTIPYRANEVMRYVPQVGPGPK